MHKGYTLNYFINFFKNIPDHQWCTEEVQRETSVQHCALGHALRDNRVTLDRTRRRNHGRAAALENFLATSTVYINDADSVLYRKLGSTPRGRILRALRNRKRYGNIFGKE